MKSILSQIGIFRGNRSIHKKTLSEIEVFGNAQCCSTGDLTRQSDRLLVSGQHSNFPSMHPQMSHDASCTQLQLLTFASQGFDASDGVLPMWSVRIYTEDYFPCSCVLLFLAVIFPKRLDVKGRFSRPNGTVDHRISQEFWLEQIAGIPLDYK